MLNRQRGSAMFLMPVGLIIVVILGAIAVDLSNAWLQKRQLYDAADAAAQDAVTAGLDRDALRSGGGYELDAGLARAAALQSIANSDDGGDIVVISMGQRTNAAGNLEWVVEVQTTTSYIFAPIIGGQGQTTRAVGVAQVTTQP